MPDSGLDERRGVDERSEVHAGLDAKTVEHVDQIFGREVAGRPGRIRAAAKPAGGRVERRDAQFERRQDIGESRPARVVEVERDVGERHALGDRAERRLAPARDARCRWYR